MDNIEIFLHRAKAIRQIKFLKIALIQCEIRNFPLVFHFDYIRHFNFDQFIAWKLHFQSAFLFF